MSEQQFHVIALSPLRNAFFDPVSRINLSRTNPQGLIPVGSPISGSIKAGLLSGGLIDVNQTILPDLLKARAEAKKQKQAGFPRPPANSGEKPADQPVVQPKVEEPAADVPQATPVEPAEGTKKAGTRSKTK